MKKILIASALIFLTISGIFSQNVDDALRYSQIFYNGTARFMSMGGAFTALGGDLSSISVNPAGTGVFRSSEFSLTPQLYHYSTSSTFNNSKSSDFIYKFNLSQIGLVSNLVKNDRDKGLQFLNLAYSYNRINNFNEQILINGISDNSSMADYWASQANGYTKSELINSPYMTPWLAQQTYLIDTLPGYDKQYGTIFSHYGDSSQAYYGQKIKRFITNEGSMGEHTISIGANFSNKLFLGFNLGINTIKYTGHYQHLESDINDVIYDFKNFTYTDHLETEGTGYSFNIGAIYKPVEFLRIGGAIHSPVIYRIREYFYDNLSSTFDTYVGGVNSYEKSNEPYRYNYTLTTPFRANLGLAFQIKKLALLSADYEYIDYRMAHFSKASDNYDYSAVNDSTNHILRPASNIKLGAEFRINKVYLRGGYNFISSAFNKDETNSNLYYNSFSFGVGFRQEKFYFDLAARSLFGTRKYYMYDDQPYLSPATIKMTRNTFSATIGFKF